MQKGNLLIGQLQNLAFKGWKDYSGLQFANYEQVWAKIGFTAFSNARAELLSRVENGGRKGTSSKGTGSNRDIDGHNSTQLATVSDLPGLLVLLAVHSAVDQFEED